MNDQTISKVNHNMESLPKFILRPSGDFDALIAELEWNDPANINRDAEYLDFDEVKGALKETLANQPSAAPLFAGIEGHSSEEALSNIKNVQAL